jgi:CheY-like chemotaxis protein
MIPHRPLPHVRGGLVTTTLLAVDDSKTIRKVLEITFGGEDFRTILASTPDEALSKLRSDNPSIALVDATLEGASGYDLCQQIKRSAPQVSVILLTSKHHPYDRSRGSAVGADDFMDKPFDTQQLIDKVRAVSQKSAASPARPIAPVVPPVQRSVGPQPSSSMVGGRQRAQTLAYGTPGPAPAAPIAPAPQARPAAPVMPARPAAPAPSPQAPAVAPAAARPLAPAPVARPAPAAPVAPAAAATAGDGAFAQKLQGLGLSQEQVQAVLALSRDVIEKVVWEVVPPLAETLIKEEIRRLTTE